MEDAVWEGSIPLEIRLSPSECRTFDQADPYLVSCAWITVGRAHQILIDPMPTAILSSFSVEAGPRFLYTMSHRRRRPRSFGLVRLRGDSAEMALPCRLAL